MSHSAHRQQVLASVVIPVFNKSELTAQCLDSIVKVGAEAPFEVIVVDDASKDDTPQLLARWKGAVRVIRNETNMGFAGACNQGAAVASGKYILFLNNDTIPLRGWLDNLVDELEAHAEVVAVGSKLLYQDGLIQHAGVAFMRETRSPYHPNRMLSSDDPRVNKRRELQAVTAACTLIRARWFRDCGGFCQQFQTGYEDVDLCLTIRRRGGRIVYQPKSVVFHLESQTPGRMRHETANRALLFERWSDQLLADEDDYYFTDDLRIVRSRDEYGEFTHSVRFDSAAEKARWAMVAECQRQAAAGARAEMLRCLAHADAWPQDAAVRRWAGAICHRHGLSAAMRAHLAAALTLEPTPELRVQTALFHPEALPAKQAPAGAEAHAAPLAEAPWEATLLDGLRLLRSRHLKKAHDALETALNQGAPPQLALPALWQAARGLGHAGAARAARTALLGLPHVDPVTAQKLRADPL